MTGDAYALQPVSCNLCGEEQARRLFPLQHSAAVRCGRCGFCYVNPRASSEELRAKLEAWSEQDIVDEERLRIAFDEGAAALYGRYLSEIERRLRGAGRRLLDVGCSTGALLTEARRLGWDTVGLEIGRAAAGYARTELGLNVECTSLFDHQPEQLYDAVVMLEVIEHLEDPAGALECLFRWVRPGGVVLLSTPNFDSLFRRLHGPRWWVVNCPDEHIMFFSTRTLRAAMEHAGFEVVASRTRGFDVFGMMRAFRGRREASEAEGVVPTCDYYDSRRVHERIKSGARSLGIARPARTLKRLVERACSSGLSPLRGLGEQIVMLGVRSGDA